MPNFIILISKYFIKPTKIIFGILFIYLFFGFMWKALFCISSDQAFINTRVASLISPIQGKVDFTENIELGTSITKNTKICRISGTPDMFTPTSKNKLKSVDVIMPFTGVVWSILINDGEIVQKNDRIIQVISPEKIWVDAFFREKCWDKLKIGRRVEVKLIDSKKSWKGKIVLVRAGVNRVNAQFDPVQLNTDFSIPPSVSSKRLVDARIEVQWDGYFTTQNFLGVGRSVVVTLE